MTVQTNTSNILSDFLFLVGELYWYCLPQDTKLLNKLYFIPLKEVKTNQENFWFSVYDVNSNKIDQYSPHWFISYPGLWRKV